MSEFASGGEPLAQQLPVADELHQSSQTESQDHELEEIEVIELEEEARPTQGQGQEPPGRSSSPSQEQPQEPRLQRRKVRAENKEPKPDTRQCRICFAGAEEEPELGRLIKPCRCKGSIRYVHVKCIDTWRKTGSAMNSSSFWACPQCGFRYAFARTKILGLSTSPWVLGSTTIALFLIIVFAASFVVSYFVPELDDPASILNSPAFDPNLNYNSGSGSDSSNSNADNSFGSIYSYSWWHSPFGIASEVIKETVQTFAEVSTPQEIRDARDARYLERLEEVKRMYQDDDTFWGRFKKRIPVQRLLGQSQSRKSQGQNQDQSQPPSKSARRVRRRDPREAYSPSEDIRPKISFWARLARKFMLGLSLVGILSFLNLLLTMSLFGPLQIARARWIRNGRREAGGLRDAGTILIIIFVVIGVVRALYGVYVTTRMVAQWVLLRAENAILEVQDDDDDDEDKAEEKKEESEYEYEDPPADKATSTSATATATTPADATATTTARPQGTEEKGEGSSNLTRRPAAINIDTARGGRDAPEDDFGGELPATPGGWRAEWEWS